MKHAQFEQFELQDPLGFSASAHDRWHAGILRTTLERWQGYHRFTIREMHIYKLHRTQWVPRAVHEVFPFFAAAENLEALTPPFLRFQITRAPRAMEAGARIEYRLRIHGLPVRWKTIIEKWDPPHEFIDVQASGPYKLWHHTHRFTPENGGTTLEDTVLYALPFGILGRAAHWGLVSRDVSGIFDFRQRKIAERFG